MEKRWKSSNIGNEMPYYYKKSFKFTKRRNQFYTGFKMIKRKKAPNLC